MYFVGLCKNVNLSVLQSAKNMSEVVFPTSDVFFSYIGHVFSYVPCGFRKGLGKAFNFGVASFVGVCNASLRRDD